MNEKKGPAIFSASVTVTFKFGVKIVDITPIVVLERLKSLRRQPSDALEQRAWERAQHERELLLALLADPGIRDIFIHRAVLGDIAHLSEAYGSPMLPEGTPEESELIERLVARLAPEDVQYFALAQQHGGEFESQENF